MRTENKATNRATRRMDENRLLRPSRLAILSDHLDEVIGEIRAFGVRISPTSRLPRMSRLLRETAVRDAYPSNEHELSVLAEAIRNAQEFVDIGNVLPKAPFHSLRQDLQSAVAGDLGAAGPSTGPHLQYQTQLWVGAMLAQAGANVGMLMKPTGQKNPDFILKNGTLDYAVEVKRPNGELDAQNIIRKAARQIRNDRFHGGMIVVDLTDCIDPTVRHRSGVGKTTFDEVRNGVNALLHRLHTEVFNNDAERLHEGREHVFGLIGFCRAGYWDLADLSYPYLNRYVGSISYWRKDRGTLRAHRARWLAELIHRGLSEAGHSQSEPIAIPWSAQSTDT